MALAKSRGELMPLVGRLKLAGTTKEEKGIFYRVGEVNAQISDLLQMITDPPKEPAPGSLTDEDSQLLQVILNAAEQSRAQEFVRCIHLYYRDADRCDRTDRRILVLHIGMLVGLADQILSQVQALNEIPHDSDTTH